MLPVAAAPWAEFDHGGFWSAEIDNVSRPLDGKAVAVLFNKLIVPHRIHLIKFLRGAPGIGRQAGVTPLAGKGQSLQHRSAD